MARVESEVIIKRRVGVSDPAGMAIRDALNRLGFEVSSVTTGKHFLIISDENNLEEIAAVVVKKEVGHPSMNEAVVRSRIIED